MSTRKRIAELDGLRGLAILFVVLYHFRRPEGPFGFLYPLFGAGWIGVDLFFVLSGYLITGILLDTTGQPNYYRTFIVARGLRILPLYYACLALYGVLASFKSYLHPLLSTHLFLSYGLFLGNFTVAHDNAFPQIDSFSPLWSLQVEEQFYLTLPFLISRVTRRQLSVLFCVASLLALLARVALWIAVPQNSLAAYVLMPCRMDALAIGGLIAIFQREAPERLRATPAAYAALPATLAFAIVSICFSPSLHTPVMRTLGFTLADLMFGAWLITAIARQSQFARLCRFRPLVYLGTISYGVYLLHSPVSRLTHHSTIVLQGTGTRELVQFLGAFTFTILAAAISWRWFEAPILNWKRQLRFSRQRAAPVTADR